MADPNLIARFYPHGQGQLCNKNALLTIELNKSRRIEPLREDFSRSTTEEPEDEVEAADIESQKEASNSADDYSLGLRLGFDDERKSSFGILIGTSPKCDIILPKRNSLVELAPVQCLITFDKDGQLILKDLQTMEDLKKRKRGRTAFTPGTAVMYGNNKGDNEGDNEGDNKGDKRCGFAWIIGGAGFTEYIQPIVIAFHDNLKFRIVVAPRSTMYKQNVARFLSEPAVGVDDLSLSQMGLWSIGSTAEQSGVRTLGEPQLPSQAKKGEHSGVSTLGEPQLPSQAAVLAKKGELGRGAFAVVIRAWNVSTGEVYASKEPLEEKDWEDLKGELDLLKEIRHDHIINCFPEFSKPPPAARLVLEYIRLGDLEDEHKRTPISVEEAFEILCQGLSALRYLHEREDPIIHRDIKPSNILVHSRFPKIHIKLSDFGLSKASPSYLTSQCGTPLYLAPEVLAWEKYDAGVDVWSLGLVTFKYAHGLPDRDSWYFIGDPWIEKIVQSLEAQVRASRCPLLTFLSTAMLVQDRKSRYSAHRCSTIVQRLDPSQFFRPTPTRVSQTYDSGKTVTRRPSAQQTALGPSDLVVNRTLDGRRHRSGVTPAEPLASASTAHRKSISRVSKATTPDQRSLRSQERGGAVAEGAEYFFNKFSNPLHPLYAGSSLGQETVSEWTSGSTNDAGAPSQRGAPSRRGAPSQRGLGKAVADEADESVVFDDDWLNNPTFKEPPPSYMPVIRGESVANGVRHLGNMMQNEQPPEAVTSRRVARH